MNRRTCIAAMMSAAVASASGKKIEPIELHVNLNVDPAKEKEMLHFFHTAFRPAASKQEGFIDSKILKLRSAVKGNAPEGMNYRFELVFRSEELRQKWVASAIHQKLWPQMEKTFRDSNYTVLLFDHS